MKRKGSQSNDQKHEWLYSVLTFYLVEGAKQLKIASKNKMIYQPYMKGNKENSDFPKMYTLKEET